IERFRRGEQTSLREGLCVQNLRQSTSPSSRQMSSPSKLSRRMLSKTPSLFSNRPRSRLGPGNLGLVMIRIAGCRGCAIAGSSPSGFVHSTALYSSLLALRKDNVEISAEAVIEGSLNSSQEAKLADVGKLSQ